MAEMGVDLDFDIIDLTFNKDGVFAVIPVVMSPIDIINPITPPIEGKDWFSALIAIIVAVIVLIVLAPILPYILKAVIWFVTLPFRAIGALLRHLKRTKGGENMTRRKNKETRKYKPKNEFRKNHSPLVMGHPNYVFGETKDKYKSLGITTHPSEKVKSIKLSKNPEPNNSVDAHLQMRVLTTNKRYFSETLKNWEFSKKDKSIVRHRIKKYKKSYNRNKKR